MSVKKTCCTGNKPLGAGLGSKAKLIGDYVFPISVPMEDSTGAANTIPDGTVADQAYITARLNDLDETKRWSVLPKISGLEAPEATDDTAEVDGINIKTGAKTMAPLTYMHTGTRAKPYLEDIYNSIFNCQTVGVFWITRHGHVVGINDGEGYLRPIELEGDTTMANYKEATKSELAQMMISLQYYELENKGCLDYIDACSIEYDARKWVNLTPLEVTLADVSADSLGLDVFTISANLLGSGFGSKFPATVTQDSFSFDDGTTSATVYNRTTSASSTITAVRVDKTDKYTITLGTAPSADDEIVFQIVQDGLTQSSELVATAKV